MSDNRIACTHPPRVSGMLYALDRDAIVSHIAAMDLHALCLEAGYARHVALANLFMALKRLGEAATVRAASEAARKEWGAEVTRAVLIRRGTARALALVACLAAAYCAAPARSSGLEAPEVATLAEPPVGREIAGRLYAVQPDSPIAFRGVPVAGWGGCWDCPTRPGVIDDEAPPVPLPAAVWFMLAGLGAVAAVKWRKA